MTTNKNLSKWEEIYGEAVIVNVILDRLLHHSYFISIIIPSYRIKDIIDTLEG
ncbi:ATP-binding protein [Thomasclavelia sp.]|uniref:ATP-binding protein n=1 Tax=Thomasclavelia sp. TaxID=3025757 RepID=UPI00345CA3AB